MSAAGPYRVSIIGARAGCADPWLRRQWAECLRRQGGFGKVQQSPEWVEHLLNTDYPDPIQLTVAYGPDERVEAVVPVRIGRNSLRFEAAGIQLGRSEPEGVAILGGLPALPESPELIEELFATLAEQAPVCDIIVVPYVPADGLHWRQLEASSRLSQSFRFYVPDEPTPRRSIELPDSLDAYLAGFTSRKRGKLRRRIRSLWKQAEGDLRLRRIERPEQVDGFADAVLRVTEHSWKRDAEAVPLRGDATERRRLQALAEAGLLRSYILEAGGVACACVLGYQYQDIYLYAEIAYDEAYARYSPGTVLFLLLIEDLCRERRPRHFDFGRTDNLFKQEFATQAYPEATVMLLRRGLRNWLRQTGHGGLRGSVAGTKLLLQRLGVGHHVGETLSNTIGSLVAGRPRGQGRRASNR